MVVLFCLDTNQLYGLGPNPLDLTCNLQPFELSLDIET